ncbi:MAG TPA: hemolysin family protein [Chitinophagaceae bacterium]|jgi:putative hemolysin|nr:HlyC/CorC family transporter [Chitinophagaceae bacterium]OPZ18958.1 MAG: Magnesium and cobalt efflux protein CorC [Bacteroidetes bacterium ADurb.BinA245]HMW65513.1 hemolysin family protein [Chitinophagaceae bacterium]HNA19209.1 hemolysin family protein [Chitinophagaceae bacterium]HNA96713.1 hemolysin family protein [Chitinophagaceae bacterium]
MEIIILLALIFLNSLFVMSEIALVSARKSKLETMAEKGDVKAKKALNLSNNPEIFLAAAQIGITFIAIVTGVYSGERFSHYISPWFEKIDFLKPYAQTIATTIIVIVVTFLSIIFGELIPKRIGLLRSESIARMMAGPMYGFAKLTHPFVWLLNKLSSIFFNIFNIKRSKDDAVTEEEIKTLITEGTEAGTIDETEQHIIERVFHLGDRNITSLMTHRSDIIWFELDDTEDKIKQKIIQEPHSVYPICEGEIDNIKGVVSIKDLYVSADSTLFKELMKPALFVPENNSAYQVLEKFRESREHCCFIVDEYGSVLGLISLNDILEAIVGDIPQPDVPDYEIIKRDDGSYLVDGQIPFYDFLTHFEKAEWMNEGEHDFDTLAGFILHELERIPKAGEKLKWKGFSIEIIDMDGHRIDKVLIKISDEIREEMEN